MNSDMCQHLPTVPSSSPEQSEYEDVEIAASCTGVYECPGTEVVTGYYRSEIA